MLYKKEYPAKTALSKTREPELETWVENEYVDLLQKLNNPDLADLFISIQKVKRPISSSLIKDLISETYQINRSLIRQNRELFFAYQTLEIGYQRYWEFFNFAPDGYLVTDLEGIIREANQTAMSLFSKTPAELRGKPITSILPEIKTQGPGTRIDWLAGPRQFEVNIQLTGLLPIEIAVNIAPQCNSSNKPVGLLWLIRDITEHVFAEKKLRESERFNSNLLKKSPSPIFVIKKDYSIGYVNPAFEKLTGFSSQKLIGTNPPFPWWITNDFQSEKIAFEKSLSKKIRKQEKKFQKKNGEQFWVEITSIYLENEDDSNYILQTWVDITESKQLKENTDFFIRQINRIQEEERKHIALDLHEDILQSLAALSLKTGSILKSKEKNHRDIINDTQEIQSKLNLIIENIRRFSYDLRPGVLDYLGLTTALETLTDELNRKGIKTNLVVNGNEKRLSPEAEIALFRIAQEALSNIKKYSHASKASISIDYNHAGVKLTISDNGIGFIIPERISDLASQGKLGILSMGERARLIGGSLSLKSKSPKGTEVRIKLPFKAHAFSN
jgi:PAS domain S-box-containing protein